MWLPGISTPQYCIVLTSSVGRNNIVKTLKIQHKRVQMKCRKRKGKGKVAADGGQEQTCSLKLKRAKCCFFWISKNLPPNTAWDWAGAEWDGLGPSSRMRGPGTGDQGPWATILLHRFEDTDKCYWWETICQTLESFHWSELGQDWLRLRRLLRWLN